MKKRKILLGALLATTAIFGIASCDGPDPEDKTHDDGSGSTDVGGEATKYTVTFNSNGGSAVSNVEVEEGSKIAAPTNPTRAATAQYSYTFAGWYKDAALTQAFNFASDTITSATTLYAKWTENVNQYTVTFNSNGGTSVSPVQVNYGGKVTQPTAPTKAEDSTAKYTFAGWYKDAALTQAFNFTSDTITSATTLYAKWDATAKHTVTFVTNGADAAIDAVTVYDGDAVSRPTDPTKAATADTRYAFAGWYTTSTFDTGTEFNFNTLITRELTLYAKWDVTNKVSLVFNTNGGTHIDTQFVFEGETATKPTDPTKEEDATAKYAFAGWYTTSTFDAGTEFDFATPIAETTTIYAKWNATAKYTVTFVTNGADATIDSQTIYDGGTVTKPTDPTKAATETTRYAFAGWYEDEDFATEFDFTAGITGDVTLYAKWTETPITYYVVFRDGNTTLTDLTQTVNALDYATKPADPTKASDDDSKVLKFGGWYKDSNLETPFDFENEKITGLTMVYAKWDTYNKISTVAEFNEFRALEASSDNFILTADIDLENVTLEATKVVFTGKFDGDGHAIKNGMYVENASNKTGLLLKELRNGGSVSNVKFVGCNAKLGGETIAIIAGLGSKNISVSKVEFNGCTVSCNNYAGFILGRTDSGDTTLNISEITCKNGCKSTVTSYGGTLIGDVNAGDANKHAVINMTDLDLSIELAGANKNGGFLSGRLRGYTDLTIKNVVIREAIIQDNASGNPGLICGGGDNNATNSNLVVENLYVMSTNSKLLQSCALQTGSNPVTSFTLSYTNCYIASDIAANITDNVINGVTLLQSVDKATADINWLDETLKLDFDSVWTAEESDASKYRLVASSTNVKSKDAVIERLKLSTANATVRFEKGTEFTADGISVTGIYSDGVNLVLNSGVEYEVIYSDYNKDVAGVYTITVKSLEDASVVATYDVEVVELLSFSVDTEFTKITYVPGEALNIKNLLVYGQWSDGKNLLFKNYTTNAESLDLSTAGVKNLVVSVAGFDSQTIAISVVGTRPVVTDNNVYINVDCSAAIAFGGERVDGVETFNTINEAIEYYASLKLDESVNKVIYIADGTYYEKITVPASLTNLKIIGESREGTILEYDAVEDTVNPLDGSKYVMNCATLHVNAENFGLENITVKNSFDYINDNTKYGNPQGFALTIAADGAVINDVTLYGNQDTLFFKKGRVYLVDSEIDGNIDFIFGENDGIAFFENCVIKAINKSTTQQNNNGYVTAMKGDATNHPTYGYVFNGCTFTDDGTLKEGSMSLGRPWGPGATVTMINCNFSAAYSTLGYDGSTKSRWFDMSGNKPGDANFAEYGSTGEGRIETAVAGGSILTADEALNYTAANTLADTNGGVKWGSSFNYIAAYNALVAAKNKVTATGILVYLDGTAITDSMSVAADDTSTLVLTSAEWNAENKAVEVSIADPTLATYEDGKLTGLVTGSTTVTFTLGEVTKTVSLEVIALPSYEITFVVPEGASAVASQTIKKNKKLEAPAAPTKTGAVFKGWFTDEACTEEYDFDTPITGELTLYARFVEWADLTKENCVYYFNGTEGDGVDTFGDGINIQKKEGTWYSISVGGNVSINKIQSRWNNTDPSKVNPDTQFNYGTTLSFAVKQNATITVTFRNLNGGLILYKFNGEAITPTVSADGLTFTYEATSDGVFMIENNGDTAVGATKNSYLSSISVTYPEVIKKTTKITFGAEGNFENTLGFDITGLTTKRPNGNNSQLVGTMVFYAEAGATVSISSYSGYTHYTVTQGGVTSEEQTGTSYSFVTTGGKIVIASTNNNNYFYNINIVYPAVIENNTTITFGNDTNIDSIEGVTYTANLRPNGPNSQVSGGSITLSVKAGATVTVYGYGGSTGTGKNDYTSYTVTANGTTSETQTGDYTVTTTAAGDVVITAVDGNNYLMSITVEY